METVTHNSALTDRELLHLRFRELREVAREVNPNDWWLKQTELTTLGYEGILYEIATRVRATEAGEDAHQVVLNRGACRTPRQVGS